MQGEWGERENCSIRPGRRTPLHTCAAAATASESGAARDRLRWVSGRWALRALPSERGRQYLVPVASTPVAQRQRNAIWRLERICLWSSDPSQGDTATELQAALLSGGNGDPPTPIST